MSIIIMEILDILLIKFFRWVIFICNNLIPLVRLISQGFNCDYLWINVVLSDLSLWWDRFQDVKSAHWFNITWFHSFLNALFQRFYLLINLASSVMCRYKLNTSKLLLRHPSLSFISTTFDIFLWLLCFIWRSILSHLALRDTFWNFWCC